MYVRAIFKDEAAHDLRLALTRSCAQSRPVLRRHLSVQVADRLATNVDPDDAKSGLMQDDALIFGWRGGARLPNAVDTSNNETMGAWVTRSLVIGLRVGPHRSHPGGLRLDSDALAQMRLLKHDA
jgi:hypothetical protein